MVTLLDTFERDGKKFEIRYWLDNSSGKWVAYAFQDNKPIGEPVFCEREIKSQMKEKEFEQMMIDCVKNTNFNLIHGVKNMAAEESIQNFKSEIAVQSQRPKSVRVSPDFHNELEKASLITKDSRDYWYFEQDVFIIVDRNPNFMISGVPFSLLPA